jgi:hypothetical protein
LGLWFKGAAGGPVSGGESDAISLIFSNDGEDGALQKRKVKKNRL